jgi:hypothetical protein
VTTTFPPPALTATPTLAPITIPTSTSEVVKFSPETWVTMVANGENLKALEALPATSPEGYVKGGFSEIKDNLVKYYSDGALSLVYNLENGKFVSPERAGIAEFDTIDGKWEMKSFDSIEKILKEIIVKDGATYGRMIWGQNDQTALNYADKVYSIYTLSGSGSDFSSGVTIKVDGAPDNLTIAVHDLGQAGAFIKYFNKDGERVMLFGSGMDAREIERGLTHDEFIIPAYNN